MKYKTEAKTDFSKADKLVDAMMKAGLVSLGNDVRKRAMILAPFDPNRTEPGPHLRSTAKVDVTAKGYKVYIGFYKPYAKRRHYENNLHPSTRFYLTNALKSITNVGKYFRPFN